jgi:ELWxxDGT repeat protein
VGELDSFVEVNGTGYFVANDGVSGRQVWRSDGTDAGTIRVSNVGAGGPTKLTAFGDRLLFTTVSGDDLWLTDGTLAGTALLRSGLSVGAIVDSGTLAFFDAQTAAEGRELWKTDGTAAGTVMVDPCPGPCALFASQAVLGSLPGIALFQFAEEDLWRSDGTPAGTFSIATFPSRIASFTRIGTSAYFAASTPFTGSELWRTDGTAPEPTWSPSSPTRRPGRPS